MPLLLNCQYQFYEMMKAQILNMVLWSQGRNCISGLGVDKTRPRVLLLELQLSMFSTWEPWTPILSWFLIVQYNGWITTGLKPGIVWRGNTSYTYSGVPIWLEAVHAENTLGWSCVFSSCFDISLSFSVFCCIIIHFAFLHFQFHILFFYFCMLLFSWKFFVTVDKPNLLFLSILLRWFLQSKI